MPQEGFSCTPDLRGAPLSIAQTGSEITIDETAHRKSGGLLVLGKITATLDAFTLYGPVLNLADIRDRTDLPASTVQRLVANLVDQEFQDRIEDGYRVGVRMAHWGTPRFRAWNSWTPPVLTSRCSAIASALGTPVDKRR
ncbi:MAG: helix-turn-helix domain-containing protein [Candidatus Corynebacterium faecigallinarum]